MPSLTEVSVTEVSVASPSAKRERVAWSPAKLDNVADWKPPKIDDAGFAVLPKVKKPNPCVAFFKGLPREVKITLAVQIVVAGLHCGAAAMYINSPPGSYFFEHARIIGSSVLLSGALVGLALLVLGLAWEDSYMFRCNTAVSMATSFVALLLLPHAAALVAPAIVLRLVGLTLQGTLVWKGFCWRELRRYGSVRAGTPLRRAAMWARGVIRLDHAALAVHLTASYYLHDSVYLSTVTAWSAAGSPLVAPAAELLEALTTLRGVALHPAIPVLHGVRSLALSLLIDAEHMPKPLRKLVLAVCTPGARSLAEVVMLTLAALLVWSSLNTAAGFFVYLAFLYRHLPAVEANGLVNLGGNVGAANAAICSALVFVIASRTCTALQPCVSSSSYRHLCPPPPRCPPTPSFCGHLPSSPACLPTSPPRRVP